jgi:ribosomal protein S18 acetylase RimI-like enzyme
LKERIEIIARRNSDITLLRELFLRVRQTSFSVAPPASFNLKDFDKETEGEKILIALSQNTAIGFISVWAEDNFIHHLYVDENYPGKGIGTALLKAASIDNVYPVRLKCLEKNVSAISFYKKHGFVEKEKGMTKDGAFVLFELYKRKL